MALGRSLLRSSKLVYFVLAGAASALYAACGGETAQSPGAQSPEAGATDASAATPDAGADTAPPKDAGGDASDAPSSDAGSSPQDGGRLWDVICE